MRPFSAGIRVELSTLPRLSFTRRFLSRTPRAVSSSVWSCRTVMDCAFLHVGQEKLLGR